MRYKFNVGDRVRVLDGSKIENCIFAHFINDAIGKEAIITDRNIIESHPCYRIKFNDMDLKRYDSYIFDERELEFVGININFLIIGRKVLSRMYKSNGEIVISEARCHPDDDFDLKTGIRIALDRLLEEISLYNGKVVCVENNGHMRFAFTKGKIYTIANGEIKDDCEMIPFRKIKSLDEFDEIEGLRFIPLVE